MTADSTLPGGLALQPASRMARSNALTMGRKARNMRLLHNVQSERHLAVARSAKHRAVADKRTGLGGGKRNLGGPAFSHFDIDGQFLEAEAMRYIGALQHQHNRLALMQRDLAGRIFESLRGHLNTARRVLAGCVLNQ